MSTSEPMVAEQAVTVTPSVAGMIEPAMWAAQVARLRAVLDQNGVGTSDLGRTVRELVLSDAAGVFWRYDGSRWERQDGTRWVAATPTAPMHLQPFALDLPMPPDADFDLETQVAAAPLRGVGLAGAPRAVFGDVREVLRRVRHRRSGTQ